MKTFRQWVADYQTSQFVDVMQLARTSSSWYTLRSKFHSVKDTPEWVKKFLRLSGNGGIIR